MSILTRLSIYYTPKRVFSAVGKYSKQQNYAVILVHCYIATAEIWNQEYNFIRDQIAKRFQPLYAIEAETYIKSTLYCTTIQVVHFLSKNNQKTKT